MCKDNAPTRFTGGPIPILGTAPPVLSPFAAAPYALNAPPDATLQAALNQAVADAKTALQLGPNPKVAFALILIARPGGVHKYAGFLDDEMMFSASVLKVGAMYAAFELRAAVRRFAAAKGTTFSGPDAFFEAVAAHFDPQINAVALPEVQKASEALGKKKNLDQKALGALSTPAYARIFSATNFGTSVDVDFNMKLLPTDANLFRDDLTDMVRASGDIEASRAIAFLSYSYISAALTRAGFFTPEPDPKNSKGIWVGSNYTSGADPFLDFQLKHNIDLAPVTTARQIARLFALIQLKQLVPDDTSGVMFNLLHGSNASFLTEVVPPITKFDVVLRKVGIANFVHSEGEIVVWRNTSDFNAHNLTGEVAVCWQNLPAAFTTKAKQFAGIARVITQAVESYLANA